MCNIRKELKEYIENKVLPEYNLNENGHGVEHLKYVTERSLKFAEEVNDINYEMVYVIASYHDIGHHIDAKHHEIVSAKILEEDQELKKFFNDEQIKIMKEAVEDHRASSDSEPRTVYGKIVSSADRNTDVDNSIKRAISYHRKHFPDLTENEVIEDARQHLIKKFGKGGYAVQKIYFGKGEYEKYLDELAKITNDKERFFEKSYQLIGE